MIGRGEYRLVNDDNVLSLFAGKKSAARKARKVSTAKAVLCDVTICFYLTTGYAVGKALCYTLFAVRRAVQCG